MTIEARLYSVEDVHRLSKEIFAVLAHLPEKNRPIVVEWGTEEVMNARKK